MNSVESLVEEVLREIDKYRVVVEDSAEKQIEVKDYFDSLDDLKEQEETE